MQTNGPWLVSHLATAYVVVFGLSRISSMCSGYWIRTSLGERKLSTVSLSAPTTGSQAGMLFFQDRSVPITGAGSTFGGSRGTGYTGAIYFPTTPITYRGNASSTSTPKIIVGYKLTFTGGDTDIKNYTYLPSGGGPITSAILVE